MPSAGTDWPSQAGPEPQARRQEYLEWIVTEFGHLEPDLRRLDGRLWSLNHARLVTGRALGRADRYFASAGLARDPDFAGIRLLKTLLDFEDSPCLSDRARDHLRGTIAGWTMTEYSRVARWPRIHTENHHLMCLTVGLFSEMLRGREIEEQLDELRKSFGWRFKWGFYGWNSPRDLAEKGGRRRR